ncbi:hypothetical protein EDB89DRAFT_2076245 [Lactarius sanguifluus]|nr:hypothetical protein EDB89DRAFT_2076245 [Lactarius sanguifluus]
MPPVQSTSAADVTLSDSNWTTYVSDRNARRARRKLVARGLTQVPEHAYPSTPTIAPCPPLPLVIETPPTVSPVPRVSTPQNGYIAQRVEKHQRDDTSDEEETRHHKYPRLAPHIGPPRARPQLARRSIPLPHKIVYKPRRATSAPVASTPRFLVPYSPSPRRPPDNPDHAPPLVDPDPRPLAPGHTVVEGDNSPMRGVKTLDVSDFDPVLAQNTADSRPQTPPRTHVFPRHALEMPRDPDEVAPPNRRRRRAHAAATQTPPQPDQQHSAQPRRSHAPQKQPPYDRIRHAADLAQTTARVRDWLEGVIHEPLPRPDPQPRPTLNAIPEERPDPELREYGYDYQFDEDRREG